jgi:hypothetical protein
MVIPRWWPCLAVFVRRIEQQRAKSAVLNGVADRQGPRCTPTSTRCSAPFISRPTISCPRTRRTLLVGVTGAEVVTLCEAQAIMGIRSVRRFLAVAGKRLGHVLPELPKQPGYLKHRRRWLTRWRG